MARSSAAAPPRSRSSRRAPSPSQQGGFLFPGGLPLRRRHRGPFPGFGIEEPDEDVDQPGDDPALTLPRAPNEDVFFHATIDKKTAVVGEQVTVSIYRYTALARSIDVRGSEPDAPSRTSCGTPLIKDGAAQTTQHASAGGTVFRVRLIDKIRPLPAPGRQARDGLVRSESYVASNRRRPSSAPPRTSPSSSPSPPPPTALSASARGMSASSRSPRSSSPARSRKVAVWRRS